MTNLAQAKRKKKKVGLTLSDEARAALAEIPQGMRSQWVDEAIREKWAKGRMT